MVVCRRSGMFKMFFKKLNEPKKEKRMKTSILDSSELESFNFSKRAIYSGKSYKYAANISAKINEKYIPLTLLFAK